MNTGMNEPEGAVDDGSRPQAAPVPAHASDPADTKDNGAGRDGSQPDASTGGDQAAGHPTITPGPAEEEDRREADDRGLTTDTGSSD